MKISPLSLSERIQEFFTSFVAILIRRSFTWHGGAFHIAFAAFVGSSLRQPYWPIGVLLGVSWLVAVFWIAKLISEKNERTASGVFLFALIMGGLGFVVGFL